MRNSCYVGCLLALIAGISADAQDSSLSIMERAVRKRPVLALYRQYAQTLRTQGVQGLKVITTPDFVLQYGELKFTGVAALKEMENCIETPTQTNVIKVRLRRVENQGDVLVVYTQETLLETRKVNKGSVTSSSDWDWRQTWRKTPQGWKLALDEQLSEQDAKKVKEDNPVTIITSGPEAAHAPASATK